MEEESEHGRHKSHSHHSHHHTHHHHHLHHHHSHHSHPHSPHDHESEEHFHRANPLLDSPVLTGDEALNPDDPLFNALIHFVVPPGPIPGCPPGLELLYDIDFVTINQSVEGIEVNMGVETANRYDISNAEGKRLYLAIEETVECELAFFAASRPFTIKIYDYSGKPILRIKRECGCFCCLAEGLCCSYGNVLKVQLLHDDVTTDLGMVTQSPYKFGRPEYTIVGKDGKEKYGILGPNTCCLICEHDNPKFHIFDIRTEEEVGKIQRIYSGFTREFYTDADLFVLDFPPEAGVEERAVLVGATFLIDFLHFEDQCGRGSVVRNTRCRLGILYSVIFLIIIGVNTYFFRDEM